MLRKNFVEESNISSNQVERMDHIAKNYEDAYLDDEPLFLDELFKDDCDHSGEKTCVENLESRVSFEKRKLNLSIFTFDESTNDQAFENMIQESLIDQSFKNLFEDKPICLAESVRNALVSYTPLKKIVDLSFEVMFEDDLKFIGNHIMNTLIMLCDNCWPKGPSL